MRVAHPSTVWLATANMRVFPAWASAAALTHALPAHCFKPCLDSSTTHATCARPCPPACPAPAAPPPAGHTAAVLPGLRLAAAASHLLRHHWVGPGCTAAVSEAAGHRQRVPDRCAGVEQVAGLCLTDWKPCHSVPQTRLVISMGPSQPALTCACRSQSAVSSRSESRTASDSNPTCTVLVASLCALSAVHG